MRGNKREGIMFFQTVKSVIYALSFISCSLGQDNGGDQVRFDQWSDGSWVKSGQSYIHSCKNAKARSVIQF